MYTIDDHCFVAKTHTGENNNTLEQHILSPHTCVQRSVFSSCLQVSKKKYIYTIDDDCFVAKTPVARTSMP